MKSSNYENGFGYEEDVELVMLQTSCDRDVAVHALKITCGNLARAILIITNGKNALRDD